MLAAVDTDVFKIQKIISQLFNLCKLEYLWVASNINLGTPGRMCYGMKCDQPNMDLDRTDLVAVVVCAGWCIWGIWEGVLIHNHLYLSEVNV